MLRLIPKSGLIAANGDDLNVQAVLHAANSPVIRFGFGELCDVRAENIRTSASGTRFDVMTNVRENFSRNRNLN